MKPSRMVKLPSLTPNTVRSPTRTDDLQRPAFVDMKALLVDGCVAPEARGISAKAMPREGGRHLRLAPGTASGGSGPAAACSVHSASGICTARSAAFEAPSSGERHPTQTVAT